MLRSCLLQENRCRMRIRRTARPINRIFACWAPLTRLHRSHPASWVNMFRWVKQCWAKLSIEFVGTTSNARILAPQYGDDQAPCWMAQVCQVCDGVSPFKIFKPMKTLTDWAKDFATVQNLGSAANEPKYKNVPTDSKLMKIVCFFLSCAPFALVWNHQVFVHWCSYPCIGHLTAAVLRGSPRLLRKWCVVKCAEQTGSQKGRRAIDTLDLMRVGALIRYLPIFWECVFKSRGLTVRWYLQQFGRPAYTLWTYTPNLQPMSAVGDHISLVDGSWGVLSWLSVGIYIQRCGHTVYIHS